jgi:hypothetical protein
MKMELKELVVNVRHAQSDVYVGRQSRRWEGSKWGNPFPLHEGTTRREVVLRYARWLGAQPELMGALAQLQCKRLGCWCAPKLCHGHVLASLAAADDPNKELVRIIAELEGH